MFYGLSVAVEWKHAFPYFRNLFPENLVEACFRHQGTIYVPKDNKIVPPTPAPTNETNVTMVTTTIAAVTEALNATNASDEASQPMTRELAYKDGMNVLGEQ